MLLGYAAGVLLRVGLFAVGVSEQLADHTELSTPVTGHERLRDALFLLDLDMSPYEGALFHQPPLVLALLYPFRGERLEVAVLTLITLVDVVIALLISRIARAYFAAVPEHLLKAEEDMRQDKGLPEGSGGEEPSGTEASQSRSNSVALFVRQRPALIGLSYLLNPFGVGCCVALSLQNLQLLPLVAAVYFAGLKASGHLSAAAMAMALYLCPLTPGLLLLPAAYLAYATTDQGAAVLVGGKTAPAPKEDTSSPDLTTTTWKSWPPVRLPIFDPGFAIYLAKYLAAVGLMFASLSYVSFVAMGRCWRYWEASYTEVLLARELTPNLGLFWYVFIEMFDRFRDLFVFIFHAQSIFYIVPLHLALGRHGPRGPWAGCGAAIGMVTLFKPYPTACDVAVMISMMLVQMDMVEDCQRQFIFFLSGTVFGLCMYPMMTAMWITRNAGNANFLYNMHLVFHIFCALLLADWIKAGIKLRRRMNMRSFVAARILGPILDAVEATAARGGRRRCERRCGEEEVGRRESGPQTADGS